MVEEVPGPPGHRQRLDESIQEHHLSFHSIFDCINDGLLILDQHGCVIDGNHTACVHMGYDKHELQGMHLSQLTTDECAHLVNEQIAHINRHGHAVYESSHRHRDGHRLPVEVSVRRVDIRGEPILLGVVRDLSEHRRTRRALQMMQHSVDRMADGAFWLLKDGSIAYANDAACLALGYSLEEILQMRVFDFDTTIAPEHWSEHWQHARRCGSRTIESTHRTKSGRDLPVEITINHFNYGDEEFHCTFVRDISARRQEQRALKMMQFAMDNMSDAVFWADADGRIAYANIAACRSLEYTLDEILSLHVYDFTPPETAQLWRQHWQELKARGSNTFESVHRTRSGRQFPVEISVNYMQYENEEYICGFARDITLRKLTDDRIARMAHFDTLTSLPNRALLYDRLDQAIAQANRYHQSLALLFIDLDGFKQINDSYGHSIGDELLKAVALRLRENARDMDTVARVGGDEFVLILNEVAQPDNAALVAHKIISTLAQPFVINGKPCQIGCSIGIALYPEDTADMEELVKLADDAMYVAKNNGKGKHQFSRQRGTPHRN